MSRSDYVRMGDKCFRRDFDDAGEFLQTQQINELEYWEGIHTQKQLLSALEPGEIRTWGLAEFAELAPDRPPMLVSPFLPAGGLGLLHGPDGVGKSLLAMTLAGAVAGGTPFLGQFPTVRGNVVYIQLDMILWIFHERVLKHLKGLPEKGIALAVGNFQESITRVKADEAWIEDVNKREPSLIIFDTLRKLHQLDEDRSDTPVQVYGAARRLFGTKPALLFIHHDRKPQPKQAASFRGSGAWKADVDVGIHYKSKTQLDFSKVRTCEKPMALKLRIDSETLLISATADFRELAAELIDKDPEMPREVMVLELVNRGCSTSSAYRAAKKYYPNS